MQKTKLILSLRIFYGIIFLVFGLNGFFRFFPVVPLNDKAESFKLALMASNYFIPLLKATEVIAGIMLIFNWHPRLSLVVLSPIIVQIAAFHLFMTPEIPPVWLIFVLMHIILVGSHFEKFKTLLKE